MAENLDDVESTGQNTVYCLDWEFRTVIYTYETYLFDVENQVKSVVLSIDVRA